MASRKPYECFRCRDNGFPNTMVYLAGKDEQGKTIYIEEDGTAHRHKTINSQQSSSSSQQSKQPAAAATTLQTQQQNLGQSPSEKIMITMLDGISKKLDRLSGLLESQKQV